MPLGRRYLACSLLLASLAAGASAARGSAAQSPAQPAKKVGEDEHKLLQAANVATDNESLLKYLKARTLDEGSRQKVQGLILDLDSDKYHVRETASKELKKLGRPALPFLKNVTKSAPLEVVKRAEQCVQEITAKTASEPVAEVVRLLALREPPGAAEVLFNYLSFADEPMLEEEVLAGIGKLTVHGSKVNSL